MNNKGLLLTIFCLGVVESASAQEPDRGMVLHLASCYFNLQQYDLAVHWYGRVEGLEDGKELVNYARALRMNREFRQAQLVLDRALKHAHENVAWSAEREQAFLLEDQGLWGQACKKWVAILNEPRLASLHRRAKLKAWYYEAYFRYGYCLFKYSQSRRVLYSGKSEMFVNLAAKILYRLETGNKEGWNLIKKDFLELLQKEEKLREAYEQLKETDYYRRLP